ncbi:MAG TPA: PAS domain-containing sensor histidine kinase [Alphaproteobacteria bacterium]|nr:PAS domain-containing sensor histidine kinase [Alphaproteobacteria bacterium]
MTLARSPKSSTTRSSDDPVRPLKQDAVRISGLSVPSPAVIESQLGGDDAANSNPDPIKQALLEQIASIETDPDIPLYVATVGGELVHANEAYIALAGINDAARIPPPADPDKPESRTELPETIRGILALVQLSNREIRLDEKLVIDGDLRYFRSTHVPIRDVEGHTVAVAGTYVDITAERADVLAALTAEHRLHDFARAASDWFWETDLDNLVVSLSDRLTDILGVPKALMVGKALTSIGNFGTNDTNGTDEQDALQAMAAHVPFRDRLFEMRTAEGEVRQFHLSGVPVFDNGSGHFRGYRGAGMDMTQRYRAEREAKTARHELEETLEELTNKNIALDVASHQAQVALNAKNEFLAAMSHELRTPLNAVIGFAEAMSMKVFGDLNERYVGYAEDIMTAGRHLLALINDVLDVSVIDSGKLSLAFEVLDLGDIVSRALNLVIVRARKKNLNADAVHLADPVLIKVDQMRATQIFVNLLSNAVKFTPEGGKVGLGVDTSRSDMVAVTIWDTGIGIGPGKSDAVFEKFRRLDENVFTRKEEGTGLGLHISRALAREMGGDLTFESEPGKGSRFTVTFPKA